MQLSINIHSSVPVYKQIENHIQFAVASGTLDPGDRLPPVHELGKTLGINFNTVVKAYRDLEVLGLIYTRRGRGCFVETDAPDKCRDLCRTRMVRQLHEIVQEAKAAGMSKKDLALVIGKSHAADVNPYEEVPDSIIRLYKAMK